MNQKDKDKKVKRPTKRGLGQHASKNDIELWTRRLKEYRLWASGVSKTEIAMQFNVSYESVKKDINACAVMNEPIEEARAKIDSHFRELIRLCFEKLNDDKVTDTAKIGYIHETNESLSRLARIHGLDKGDVYNVSNTTNILAGIKIYEKWDDEGLIQEFKRRNLLLKEKNE